MWEYYTPKIQVLELFPYTDEGWLDAQRVEDRLILPDLNNPLCLNESCGSIRSLLTCSKAGSKGVVKTLEEKDEKGRSINSLKGATVAMERGVGVTARTPDKMSEDGRKGGLAGGASNAKNKTGICGRSKEKMTEDGRKAGELGGAATVLNKIGIHALSKEQLREQGLKVSSQVWESTVDGFRSSAGNVAKHNKSLGYDPKDRIRIL
jgi:hypothetical protein